MTEKKIRTQWFTSWRWYNISLEFRPVFLKLIVPAAPFSAKKILSGPRHPQKIYIYLHLTSL